MSPEDRDYLIERLGLCQRQDLVERVPARYHYISGKQIVAMLDEAVERFRRGDWIDGLTSAERALFPKWASVNNSGYHYAAVMDADVQAAA